MFLLAHVCAEFHDRKGNVIHQITRNDLNLFREAPDAIQEDILFRMLAEEGAIEFPPKDEKERKKMENNPLAGVDATGRRIVDAGGVSQDDSEVTRNKRSVRGTAAPIEGAERKKKPEFEITEAETKPAQAETVAETKAAGKADKAEPKK